MKFLNNELLLFKFCKTTLEFISINISTLGFCANAMDNSMCNEMGLEITKDQFHLSYSTVEIPLF